ncbi:hypothetical protein BBP40_007474 [Aspergillus hancockii]|nr:hypothetical protein BBP40_007474 [Aspergillus hancockii]
MSPYTYSPLPPGHNTTRMLRLLPNEDKNASIECEIVVHCLKKRAGYVYEALSYVWGPTDDPSMIYINGCALKVTSNLHTALLRLRLQRFERLLWVDAICIDQENNSEKEQQIWIMSEIYGQAKNVIVWLGEEKHGSTEALESIRLVAEGDTPQVDINDTALIALLRRPWFRRVWVLQEVGVARSVLVRCGPMEMTGYAFSSGLRNLESLNDSHPDLRNSVISIRSVTYLLGRAIFRLSYGIRSKRRHPLGELLDMYHAHEATIRHDKIFALLGMCSDDLDAVGLLPHYDIPWDLLFQRVIRHTLSEDVSIKTWPDKELALIRGMGYTLGRVSAAYGDKSRFDRQHVHISFNSTAKSFGCVKVPTQGWDTGLHCNFVEWTLRVSAQPVKPGDIVCILQGASKPSIVRLFNGYFGIIMTGVTPLQSKASSPTSSRRFSLWEAYRKPAGNYLQDFLLVWNWEKNHLNK